MIARKFKIPGKVPKLPSQFWQAGHDCHDHKRMAPSEKSAGEKTTHEEYHHGWQWIYHGPFNQL